jgi:hypothetical protein
MLIVPFELVDPHICGILCIVSTISPSTHCPTGTKLVYQWRKTSTLKLPNPTHCEAGTSKIAVLDLTQHLEIPLDGILV